MSSKETLHLLIEACGDERLVEQAIALFTAAKEDWWATLPFAEQQKTIRALEELDLGKGIAHEAVMEAAWKTVYP